ncbi:MAG: CinA family protein, partial [Clostridiales bacterium]|nr:CinA family protein [Clostridiales bacterium]
AKGAAKAAGADVALSITGIAGPDGGTKDKPVGLVYIGCYVQGYIEVLECHFSGNRAKIREASVARAIDFGRRCVMKYGK